MKYEINGTIMQTITFELKKDESIYTQSGSFAWMSDNIEMTTNAKGGILKGIGRVFSGESFFLTHFKCMNGNGLVSLSNSFPGKIMDYELTGKNEIIIQKNAFMAATPEVDVKIHFTKRLGAGFFGGEGFILQKVSGKGHVFLEMSGELSEIELQPGQELKVDTSLIGMFEPSIEYDIRMIPGVKNILFGGEGIFFATLRGPGKVWLQSTTISNLAARVAGYIPK